MKARVRVAENAANEWSATTKMSSGRGVVRSQRYGRPSMIGCAVAVFCLFACVGDVGPLEDVDRPYCSADGTLEVGAGLIAAAPSGCEVCGCGLVGETTCPGGGCSLSCDPILCRSRSGEVIHSRDLRTCSLQQDCGVTIQGVNLCVYFKGCSEPLGRCVPVRLIRSQLTLAVSELGAEGAQYCGCDGQTYEDAYPDRPYAYSGPCEEDF